MGRFCPVPYFCAMHAYLDNAATTPVAPEVADAMIPYLREHFGNPSAQYAIGRTARAAVEQARKTIAGLLGAHTGDITFTSGGTEANNIALWSAVQGGARRIITTAIEHPCVLRTVEYLHQSGLAQAVVLPVDGQGRLSPASVETALRSGEEKALVSVMHANNEIGVLNDMATIGRLCREHGALFHTDTVQTLGVCPIDVTDLPADYLSGSAHKFHGPKGTGFLYARKGAPLEPLMHGGGQERGRRPGTENVASIVGMATALELACKDMDEHTCSMAVLRAQLLQQLRERLVDVQVNGPEAAEQAIAKVLNVSFQAGGAAPLLLFNLDMAGVYVSGGSACSSGAHKGSHVLEAIGADPDRPAVRFSLSRYTTAAEVDYAVETLEKILMNNRAR